MTLAGPRPALPREVEQYGEYEKQRLYVTPGLSCYWQIAPHRNDLSFEEWMDLDVKYVKERSFWVDWKIIFKTFKVCLLGHRGSYMSKEKVGIITYHFARNYGAVLQCYALRKFLEKVGYDATVLNAISRVQEKNNSVFHKKDGIKNVIVNVVLLPFVKQRLRK